MFGMKLGDKEQILVGCLMNHNFTIYVKIRLGKF